MSDLVDLLNEHTPAIPPFGRLIVIAALFLLAWLISRVAGWVASVFVRRNERNLPEDSVDVVSALRQRQTAISLARTSVGVAMYALAALLSFGVVIGANRFQTLVGASFLVILIAFAAQRFLADVIAGVLMFQERWFRIGDTVVFEPLKIQGVVENVTVRSVTVRGVGGELMRVSNSEIDGVRVLPRGYRKADIEIFVKDAEEGRALVEQVAGIVPAGPTHFVRRPVVVEEDTLEEHGLHRIRAVAAVPLGREWLAEDLLPSLLRERAGEGLIVHGPVVMWGDEQAEQRFARATRIPLAIDRPS